MTTTDRDIRDDIITALDGRENEYNLDALVEAYLARYGLTRLDAYDEDGDPLIAAGPFWDLVADHAKAV